MTAAIEIEGLRKVYRQRGRDVCAVDGLDLSVPEGGVFGFLGPNGSGKTTTIRSLLGLVRATSGRMSIRGHPTPQALSAIVRDVGAIVETPALFPTMTGRENLRLLAAINRIGRRRVDECLEVVGLSERAGSLVKNYSLGMRQRLGLAAALLKDPAVLILDEPANGLDPAGIREIRLLLRRLGADGRTVFVSSHQLAEVENTCDRVAIIADGRLRLSGRVDEVLADAARSILVIGLDDLTAGAELIRRTGMTVESDGERLQVAMPSAGAAQITRLLADSGLYVNELRAETVTLEDLFLELTSIDTRVEEVAA